jgi:SAM-dependent methyltransferase
MPETISYSSRFQDQAAVELYEAGEYRAESYASQVWQWQRPVVAQIIQDFRRGRKAPVRLLDFACGTGRVLACVESLVDAAEGVDISEKMVALARTKCRQARFQVGDILAQPEMLQDHYDLITAFRFLLNVEPEMRGRILRRLREVIHSEGRLVVNVHGNSRSLRHPALLWRRWRERTHNTGAMLNEMSPAETKTLLRACGFEIVRQFGFGLLPPTLYRTPLRPLAGAADRWFAGENGCKNISIDLLFVCRPS